MARPFSETYEHVFEILKIRPYSTASWLFENYYEFFGHTKFINFKRTVSRARYKLLDSLIQELCHFHATSSIQKLSLQEIDYLLFNDISTSINECHLATLKEYSEQKVLTILIDFYFVLCNNRVISSLNSLFAVLFDVHGGGCGEFVKVKHYSFNIPWSYFGVDKACRIDFGSNINEDGSLSPRFVIFDRSSRHSHEPHVETDSPETFVYILINRLKGFSGVDLWNGLNGKVSYFTGRPKNSVI